MTGYGALYIHVPPFPQQVKLHSDWSLEQVHATTNLEKLAVPLANSQVESVLQYHLRPQG